MADRPTFSPFWYRVRALKARLRPHVQITRQHYRGRRWHVVHDPATNQFYRLNPIAHEFVGLLDGSRTIEEVWNITLEHHGDAAPTQNEIIQLLSQLYQSNLLSVDATPETEQLLRRGRERFKAKAKQQAIGIMYFRIKLFNPDAIFGWLLPFFRPLINKWGFLFWAAFVIFALSQLAPHWRELVEGTDQVFNPKSWLLVGLVFIVTKAIHESGHGVICKKFGGQVPEFGFMLLVLFPAPYVDASASWAFGNKWQRIAVGAGGMIVELFVAAIAALVWINTVPDSLANQLAYYAIFTASVSTVLFNANPLMRFDGYYILSDLLEVPNLMQRSMNQLKYFFKVYVYRMKQEQPPTTQPGERAVLYTYGLAAMCYRIFLFISITLYVMGKLFAIGLILAIWTAGMWFILPVGKFVQWLATNPSLNDFRPRAIATSFAMIAAVVIAFGVVPFPDHRRASGVIESVEKTGVFVATPGFVDAVQVVPGQQVAAGDTLLSLSSPELESTLRIAIARRDEMLSAQRQAELQSVAAADVAQERIEALSKQIEHLERERSRLVLHAPHAGRVVGDPTRLIGSFIDRGRAVCEIVNPDGLRVAAVLQQKDAAWHFEVGPDNYDVEIRLVSRVADTFTGAGVTVIEAGQAELPHQAMGYAGGGSIETDQQDQSGKRATDPQFVMRIAEFSPKSAGTDAWHGLPGERVSLRFTLPAKPLMYQWVDRLHKLVQGRVRL